MAEGRPQSCTQVISRLAAPLAALVLVTALAAAFAQRYGDEGGPPAAGQAGVSSGVFTAEQAERGAQVFAQRCSGCHGAQLQGGMGPRLAPLSASWERMSLAALYRFVSRNMPYDAPGSLEPQQYADVLAHVLASNGHPPGDAELPADAEALEAFVIDSPPGR